MLESCNLGLSTNIISVSSHQVVQQSRLQFHNCPQKCYLVTVLHSDTDELIDLTQENTDSQLWP